MQGIWLTTRSFTIKKRKYFFLRHTTQTVYTSISIPAFAALKLQPITGSRLMMLILSRNLC